MAFILSLDQGTTSSRALVFDADSHVVAMAQQEFPQRFPQPGWVEHDPMAIWSTQMAVLHGALAKAHLRLRDIAAIGITNQRETTLVWDKKTGAPLAPAIVWQDRRTAGLCDRLRAQGFAETLRAKTGLELDAYFSASKLQWLLDNVSGLRARAERGEIAFGTVDSWLVWQLTRGREHLTDISNASRTLLYNIHDQRWDDELLALFDIPATMLPRVVPSSGHLAEAEFDGERVPIAGIAGDQQAALFGQACHRPGLAKNTYGTGCFLLRHTGEAPVTSAHRLISTIAWQCGNRSTQYALEGSVFIGGAVVQWLRDGLKIIRNAADIEALAQKVPDNGGVYFVPAFAGLGAPHWDAYARGAIIGLTRGTQDTHLARAALEAIALQSADMLEAMNRDTGEALTELRVDGGAAANNLLMQIQADFLGVPVVRPKNQETTALGAAQLAGLAVGYWRDAETLAARWEVDRVFEPTLSADQRETVRAQWRRAVERAKGWESA
ncbi:MAG: glycerol kinase GlpK [Betaproteobacteria bacterium]|nr:glycerol kinase GlpK [Betaproteobacteria bacterium]